MSLHTIIERCAAEFERIDPERKASLVSLAELIQTQIETNNYVDLIAICTHNSRRSQLVEIWFKIVSIYYDLNSIFSYSGGTEATAFNYRMIDALEQSGFVFDIIEQGDNPKYIPIPDFLGYEQAMFSKVYDHTYNPSKDYVAIMVCDHADQNCPIVTGAAHRFSLPYLDPKGSDGSPNEKQAYLDTILTVGREILFIGKTIANN